MQICARSLARVPRHARNSPKAPFILLEYFRLNRQDFRRGWVFSFTYRQRRRRLKFLPIVGERNYVTTPLDRI
ncbi:hypothetical protein ACFQ71_02845 [Streptomyces sp. NPDC056534]|uniref:hypothetical protein n=1 Tax=Streptomyces sp. NPDC056534 TaxID=3345857 RepID=UPI0036C15CE1